MLETRDGGKTWSPAAELQPLPGESVFAASNSAMTASGGLVWLGTSKARVLRTRDLVTWQSAQTPLASGNDSSGVFSLAFRDQKHGIAVGGDYRKPEEATALRLTPRTAESTGAFLANCPMGTVLPWPGTRATKPGSRWAAMDPISPTTMASRGNGSIVVIGMPSACRGPLVPMARLVSWERFRPTRSGVSR